MSSIGTRLREERLRLGKSQTEMGELGGVRKQAQIKYEKDLRAPDAAYLERIAYGDNGVDVRYVLTGRREADRARMRAEQALDLVLDVLSELGIREQTTAEQLRSLLGLTAVWGTDRDELRDVIRAAYALQGAKLPGRSARTAATAPRSVTADHHSVAAGRDVNGVPPKQRRK